MDEALFRLCCTCIWTLDLREKAYEEAHAILGEQFGVHSINLIAWIQEYNAYPSFNDLPYLIK